MIERTATVHMKSKSLGLLFDNFYVNLEQKGLRWLPASFGARSRGSNIRHFVQHPNPMHNFNPARNAYEFGLG